MSVTFEDSAVDEITGQDAALGETLVMTIARHQRVGIAWCPTATDVIRYCEIADSVPFWELERILRAIEPNVILTSVSASEEFKSVLIRVGASLSPETQSNEISEAEAFPSEKLFLTECRGNQDFGHFVGPNALIQVHAEEFAPEKVNATIQSWIDIEGSCARQGFTVETRTVAQDMSREPLDEQGPTSRACVAALISFLTTRCGVELHSIRAEPFHLEHLAIAPMSLLQELRVLPEKPSKTGWPVGNGPNAPTLVHLIGGFTFSKPGQRKVREALAQPLCDPERIHRRLEVVQALKDLLGGLDLTMVKRFMRAVHDPQRHWRRLVSGAATAEDWRALHASASAVAQLFGAFQELVRHVLLAGDRLAANSSEASGIAGLVLEPQWYTAIAARIEACINLQASKTAWQPSIKTGFDENLDSMRLALASLEGFLDSVAASEKNQIFRSETPDHTLRVLFYPRIGYVIQMSRADAAQLESDDSVEQVLESDAHVFLKNNRMRQLDEELGDLPGAIADLEKRILQELEVATIPAMPALSRACDLLAESDCWLAFAQAALRFGWTRPEILGKDSNCQIDIVGGRHPICELIVESFVPNTISLKRSDVCIVTGPNASGKSVFLRQIALITHMAQVGSFVPAQSARIGVADRIFARVRSFDSIGNDRSTFMNDCAQMAQLLAHATPLSLAIIDEFGKGTSDEDGRALAAATLHELSTNTSRRATVLFATHFHEVANTLYSQPQTNARIRFFSLKVLLHSINRRGESALSSEDIRLTALYELTEGTICQGSHAIACAHSNGMPQCVLSRAFEIRRFIQARQADPDAASEIAPALHILSGEAWLSRRRQRLSKIVKRVAAVTSSLVAATEAHKDPRILEEVQQLLLMVGHGCI
jgi:DNA mismatch repair ATPase MutS